MYLSKTTGISTAPQSVDVNLKTNCTLLKYLFSLLLIVVGATCVIPMVGAQSATMDEEFAPAPMDFMKSEVISYEKDVRPIMSYYCVSCHGGKRPSKKFALTTYEEVREKTESGPLLQRINDERKPMPKSGLMPKYKREIIEKWAKGGYAK